MLWEQDSGAAGGLPTELAGIIVYRCDQISIRMAYIDLAAFKGGARKSRKSLQGSENFWYDILVCVLNIRC